MNKSELVARVAAQNPHLSERDIEQVVNTILGRISDALINGDRVKLRGWGSFTVAERGARTTRNPRNGEVVSVETRRLSQFKSSKAMQARVNPSEVVTGAELNAEVERLSRTL